MYDTDENNSFEPDPGCECLEIGVVTATVSWQDGRARLS